MGGEVLCKLKKCAFVSFHNNVNMVIVGIRKGTTRKDDVIAALKKKLNRKKQA